MRDIGVNGDNPPAPPPMGQGASGLQTAQPERLGEWVLHFGLAIATNLVVSLSVYLFGLGFLLAARIFRSTGFRARDLLLLWVPFANAYFVWRALWRFTARSRYWSPRTDLTPHTVFGPGRTLFVESDT